MDTESLEETRSNYYVKPWRRMFAKLIDYFIFMYFLLFTVGVAAFAMYPVLIPKGLVDLAALGVALTIGVIPLEAVCISVFGYTPGKFIMSERVVNAEGRKPKLGKALARTFKSYLIGVGMGVPVLFLFTAFATYNQLDQEGVTIWDRSEDTYVIQDEMRWWKWGIAIACIGALILIKLSPLIALWFAN